MPIALTFAGRYGILAAMRIRSRQPDLGRDPVGRLVVRLAVPAVAAQIINLLYNLVDRMYVGAIEGAGTDALAGLGVVFPITLIVSAFSSLIGMEHLSAESVLFVLMVAAGVIGLQATGRGHARCGRFRADVPAVPATSFRWGRIPSPDTCARCVGSRVSRTVAEGRSYVCWFVVWAETNICGSGPTVVIMLPFVYVRNRSYSFANERFSEKHHFSIFF